MTHLGLAPRFLLRSCLFERIKTEMHKRNKKALIFFGFFENGIKVMTSLRFACTVFMVFLISIIIKKCCTL